MRILLAALWLLLPGSASAATNLSDYAYHPHPGAALPLTAVFRDQNGRMLRLGDLVGHGRPVILALVYFRCPNLCGVIQGDLMHALAGSGLATPADYSLVTISIDPRETPADAATAAAQDRAQFDPPGAGQFWHFLVGDADAIRAVADAVGYADRFDDAVQQFIHPAGVVFVTGAGRVSDYLLGVGYQAGELRAGVLRAGADSIAKSVLPVLLLCFHFDPATGRYDLAVMRLVQIASALFVLTAAGTFWLARGRRP